MGLVESKVILQKLSAACQEAERQGSSQLDGIMQDLYTIRSLQTLWARIPENTQRSITGLSNGALGEKFPRPRRKRQKTIKPKISLPEYITNNLSSWVENPLEFFCDTDDRDVEFSISSFYRTLLHLERHRDIDLIRSRFLKVIFYKLRQSLGMQRLHSRSVETIAQIISTTGLVKDSLEAIKTHINDWSKEGKKLESLCQDLYRDSEIGHQYLCMLFCLPNDVTKEYLRVLHEQGPKRMKAIQALKERGILAVGLMETLEHLADALYTHLWGCIGPLSHQASIDNLTLQQETFNEPLPIDFSFNPQEAFYQTSIDNLLSVQLETFNEPLPSDFPFNPREALQTLSGVLFPSGAA